MARSVLVIQHVDVEPPGLIAAAIAAAGHAIALVRVDRGERVPRRLAPHAGLVVMGGPMGVGDIEALPHLRDELALIGDAVAQRAPMLGVCLGSQLLAHALGARVAPGPRKEIGWHDVALAPAARDDALLRGEAATLTPLSWHGDAFALPAGAVALAASALTAHQAFRHGERAWGLLFHLEVGAEQVRRMLATFVDELAGAGIDPAPIAAGLADRLAAAQAAGRRVFARWASLVGG